MKKFMVVKMLFSLAVVAGLLFVSASSASAQSGFGYGSNTGYGNYFHPTYSNHVNHHGLSAASGYNTYYPGVAHYGTAANYGPAGGTCGNSTSFAPGGYTRNYGVGNRLIFRRW